jgi:Domain of Unknown Function (DUF748)
VKPWARALQRRWLRRSLWAGAALLGVWALAWAVVPSLLKSQLQTHASEALGRTVTVGAVDFKPWSLELTLTDVAIAHANPALQPEPQLHIARVYVDAEMQSLLRLAPVVDALTLDTPTLHLAHTGSGHYDIDDVLERLRTPPDEPPTSPARFALYNLHLRDGAVDFADQPATGGPARVHTVRKLQLSLPFLSTFDSKRSIEVEPRLALELNGSALDTHAEGTPFAQTRQGQAQLRIAHLDLAPYLPYWPAGLPVKPLAAVVDADLQVQFAQNPATTVQVRGGITLSGLELADAQGGELFRMASLHTELADVRPLERIVHLAAINVQQPDLRVSRSAAGQINILQTLATASAPKIIAAHADSTGAKAKNYSKGAGAAAPASAQAPSQDASAKGQTSAQSTPSAATASTSVPTSWVFTLDRFSLQQGRVRWQDAVPATPAQLQLDELTLQAQGLQWPWKQAAQLDGSARLTAGRASAALQWQAQGTLEQGTADAQIDDAALALAAPYVAMYLEPALVGTLQAQAHAQWDAKALQLVLPQLSLRDVALTDRAPTSSGKGATAKGNVRSVSNKGASASGGGPRGGAATATTASPSALPRFALLDVQGTTVNLTQRTVQVGSVRLASPSATVLRDAQGQWMASRWLKAAPDTPLATPTNTTTPALAQIPKAPQAAASAPASTPAAGSDAANWRVRVASVVVDGGRLHVEDLAQSKPVALDVSALHLQAKNATLDGVQPMPLVLSARVGAGQAEAGSLRYDGTVAWAPLAVQGTLDAQDIPAHVAAPYMADRLNIELLRADASFKGQLRYASTAAGPQVQVRGDAALEDFRANTLAAVGTLSQEPEELLQWKSLQVPGIDLAMAPGTPLQLSVREAALTDFYARVIVSPSGRINLQDVLKPAAPAGASTSAPATAVSAAPPAAVAAGTPDPLAPRIRMGPISLVKGTVQFSDRFIQPNYSANLSELTGKLSQFSSMPTDGVMQLADLELRGRAEGTASLDISGKVNPLAKPLALDVVGKVRDLELPPLSPYAIKYAGYGIERGKLSVDVAYRVAPDGQLTATNKLVLNQLSFGDKVQGAPNSLPVKLAVALLADRHGVIDLDLPISGSLNDPQFSIGPVVWKVITNLVVKAITSPFALLSHALGGGGEELSTVAFAPGSSTLSPQAMQGLDKVAKALTDRPSLKLTVTGTASEAQEREGYKRERLRALLLTEKRRQAVLQGQDASAITSFVDTEYPALLKQVYKRADIPKPRNMVGLAKDIAPEDMEKLLLASITITPDAMRDLALQRGVVVKDYLAAHAVPLERMFLGAAKTQPTEEGWSPKAELGLASQ